MSESLSSTSEQSQSSESSAWDSLADLPDSPEEMERQLALRSISDHADSCRSIERRFERRLSRAKDEGLARLPAEEFEEVESRYAREWRLIQSEVAKGHFRKSEEATAESAMFRFYNDQTVLHDYSIDVYAGKFYHERAEALLAAISASDSPSKEADKKHIDGFFDAVAAHLDYRYMTPEDIRDYGEVRADTERTHAHNRLIKYFNHMNELCEAYGTRRFTVRDFWDTEHLAKSAQTNDMQLRLHSDRDTVEEYYANAFPNVVRRYSQRLSRSLDFLR